MDRITTDTKTLKRIVASIAPAAAKRRDLEANHFTETVLVQPWNDGVRFTCTDGFRLHQVEAFKGQVHYDGIDGGVAGAVSGAGYEGAVFGLNWLKDVVKNASGEVELVAHRTPSPQGELWRVQAFVPADQALEVTEQSFELGKWPNVDALIDHEMIEEGAVGVNPGYFSDLIKAALAWWDKGDPDDSMPLVIHQMAPQKVCTFTLRNSIGRLKLSFMPKISDDDEY